jgi:hypothetical protein
MDLESKYLVPFIVRPALAHRLRMGAHHTRCEPVSSQWQAECALGILTLSIPYTKGLVYHVCTVFNLKLQNCAQLCRGVTEVD